MLSQFVRQERFLFIVVVFLVKLMFFDGFLKACSHIVEFAKRMHDLHKTLGSDCTQIK